MRVYANITVERKWWFGPALIAAFVAARLGVSPNWLADRLAKGTRVVVK